MRCQSMYYIVDLYYYNSYIVYYILQDINIRCMLLCYLFDTIKAIIYGRLSDAQVMCVLYPRSDGLIWRAPTNSD